jgi:D-3-phosphoglycerate dehydrogenase
MKVLVTPTSMNREEPGRALERLLRFAGELVFNPLGRPLAGEELISLLSGCDAYIAGLDFVSQEVIESCGGLRVISRYGAGFDRVDIAAARARNIPVCNTPGVNAQGVADLAMGLLLCAARRIPMLDGKTRQGGWVRSTGMELYGKTMGLVGLGAVGKGVAKRAQGFSMEVTACDPFIDKGYAEENHILLSDFDSLIKKSDVLSLHIPLSAETRHIINRDVMESMKEGAIIINTARGGLIDEKAAFEFLKSGRLGGLGLDAFEEEPPGASPLFGLDNVVVTPHTGAHTREAAAAMADMAVQNLIDILEGRPCPYIVNP